MEKVPIKNSKITARKESDGNAILFDHEKNSIFILNQTGLFIWNLCDGNHNVNKIIEKISISFSGIDKICINKNQLNNKIGLFLGELEKHEMINFIDN